MTEERIRIQGYQLLFELAGKCLYTFPTAELIGPLLENGVFEEEPIEVDDNSYEQGAALLREWSRKASAVELAEEVSDLRIDATRLFAGYQSILTPPWESVYFNKERMIFQRETLEVRTWYKRHGLQLVQKNHEPDDHIGLELDFIGLLLGRYLDESDAEQDYLSEALSFVKSHPALWVGAWADLVCEHARSDYYRGLALLAKGTTQGFLREFDAAGGSSEV